MNDINLDLKGLVVKQSLHYKRFLAACQKRYTGLLVLQNEEQVLFLTKLSEIPKSILFINKKCIDEDEMEYYFKNTAINDTYCVFGYQAACLFYPPLKRLLETAKAPVIMEPLGRLDKQLTIIHANRVMEFPRFNKIIEIKTLNVFH